MRRKKDKMQLKGKHKRFLRKKAHHYNPIFQIGKNGINSDILSEIDDALEKRELVKIQLLQNTMLEPSEVKNYIEENSTIQIVQVIGNVLILYKSSSNEKNQSISDEVRAL